MKKIILPLLLICCSYANAASVCDADPFLEGCVNELSAANKLTAVLCNDGTLIKNDGSTTDKDGNVITSLVAGGVDGDANLNSSCKSKGGINAFIRDSAPGILVVNGINVALGAAASAASATSSASASAGAGAMDIGLILTGGGPNLDGYVIDTGSLWVPTDDTGSGAATSSGVTSGPTPPSCSSACQCSGQYDACIAGVCTNIDLGGGSCSASGELVKGDFSCQYLCSGGMFVCPAEGGPCP